MAKKNLIVGQSGGPTAVINSSLYGVVSEGLSHPDTIEHVYGMVNGIEGFLNDCILDFEEALPGEDLNGLKSTPGAYLGSCRYKLPESLEDPVYPALFKKFEELNIGWFFYIGGNDSMDTVSKLSRYAEHIGSSIRVIGEPKTIDNDLVHTDHTPGFGSAAKYVASTVRAITTDANVYEKKSVTIIEIMGRHAGWLTAASALARKYDGDNPLFIYLPEVAFNKENFLNDIREKLKTLNNVIVAVSEGIRDENGDYITASKAVADQFGHQQLSGAGKALEFLVKENIGVKVRSVEVNVLQRCAAHIASKTDLDEAFALGEKAVSLAEEGETATMVTLTRTSNTPYTVTYGHAPIRGIANEAKSIPREWINETGNDIMPQLQEYLLPLIQGEVTNEYKDGVPVYMPVSHLKPKIKE